MISTQDVLDAFNSLKGTVEQPQALKARLESQNLGDATEVVDAINDALTTGHLLQTPEGGIRKP